MPLREASTLLSHLKAACSPDLFWLLYTNTSDSSVSKLKEHTSLLSLCPLAVHNCQHTKAGEHPPNTEVGLLWVLSAEVWFKSSWCFISKWTNTQNRGRLCFLCNTLDITLAMHLRELVRLFMYQRPVLVELSTVLAKWHNTSNRLLSKLSSEHTTVYSDRLKAIQVLCQPLCASKPSSVN